MCLVLCSYIYYIRQERNSRFHGGSASSGTHIVDCVPFVVRNIVSDMKNVPVNNLLLDNWGLSDRVFVYIGLCVLRFFCK